jgi:hypothetical protein
MTRDQAIRKLKALYGEKLCYRVGNAITSADRRAAALERLRELRAAKEQHDQDVQARLNALDWYQAANAHRRELVTQIERAQGEVSHFKFSVGVNRGWCFEITGSGDTWEEAIQKAEAKK